MIRTTAVAQAFADNANFNLQASRVIRAVGFGDIDWALGVDIRLGDLVRR